MSSQLPEYVAQNLTFVGWETTRPFNGSRTIGRYLDPQNNYLLYARQDNPEVQEVEPSNARRFY